MEYFKSHFDGCVPAYTIEVKVPIELKYHDSVIRYDDMPIRRAASYHGNRLIDVSESVNNQPDYDLMEFKKGNTPAPHYAYDGNGNLTRDNHKNISTIQYNYLHLPKLVTFGDGESIAYVHDASGVKHEVKHTNSTLNPATSTTTYAANKIYEDGDLSMVMTEDGYLKKQGNTFRPFYYLKDHLGSNRMVIDGTSGGVVQATDHYPFGMSFADNPPSDDQYVQRYKYTGKELDRQHGLNLYDYHARMYDPAIGRFTTPDPLAEKYYSISPYAYCNNNPVNYVDFNGDSISFSEQRDDQNVLMGVTMNVTGKVINVSSNTNVNMSNVAKRISDQITSSFGGSFDGITFSTKVNLSIANSMDDVEDSDHLFALADFDNSSLGTFKKLHGSASSYGGKVAFINADLFTGLWDSNIGNLGPGTAAHEFGHLTNLRHGYGLMQKESAGILFMNSLKINSDQLRNIHNSFNYGGLNQRVNYEYVKIISPAAMGLINRKMPYRGKAEPYIQY